MINEEDEDEDVIIQGSALHQHLSRHGYVDFESIPVQKVNFEETSVSKTSTFIDFMKTMCKGLFSTYSWITQERNISQMQLKSILCTEVFLDDHASTVQGFVQVSPSKGWISRLYELFFIGAIMASSTYVSFSSHKRIFSILFVSSTLCIVSYIKYSRMSAHKDLKCLISLQNELFYLCKKGLKILRHDYKMKSGPGKRTEPFHDFTAEKLKYLQPVMETMIKYLENITYNYYHVSLALIKLLPTNVLNEGLTTKFEPESFQLHSEIDYQKLKSMYHTYILLQSEMLYLLSITYNTDTWTESCKKIPEMKLAHLINVLTKYLMVYKEKLSRVINKYYSSKVQPIGYEYKGPAGSKWQDLYVQLDLTSHKVQLAYNHISSILRDIDLCMNEPTINGDLVESMMQKMNEAYKQIDTARNFAEFSTLLIAKARHSNAKNNDSVIHILVPEVNSDLPAVTDSEPQIVDEVFEEYIKEEYIKPLYEEDDILLQDYKLDKLLAKNFLCELKEALIDKHKSMSERESKALQRMYKNMIKDSALETDTSQSLIPVPPPMPSIDMRRKLNDSEDSKEINIENKKEGKRNKEILNIQTSKEESLDSSIFLPQIRFQIPPTQSGIKFPPTFLKSEEETFIGSGENSEEEYIEDENDRDFTSSE